MRIAETKLELTINDIPIPSYPSEQVPPLVHKIPTDKNLGNLSAIVWNNSLEQSEPVAYIYLLTKQDSAFTFKEKSSGGGWSPLPHVKAPPSDVAAGLARQYRLRNRLPALPSGTFEKFEIMISIDSNNEDEEYFWLRFHTSKATHSYAFRLAY